MKRFQKSKGFVIGVVAAVILCSATAVFAASIQAQFWTVAINVNGIRIPGTSGGVFYKNDIYLPAKYLASSLGLSYSYNSKTGIIDLKGNLQGNTPVNPPVNSPTTPTSKLTVDQIAKKSISVVLIDVYDSANKLTASASGFIVSGDGLIVTNYHVIKGASSLKVVLPDNSIFAVDGVYNYDEAKDLAILKITPNKLLPYLDLGDSSKVNPGESIVAVGNPLGSQNTISSGFINNIKANLYRLAANSTDMQISVPISPGSSGGALFNMYGQVIGVTTAYLENGQNINFAISINEVKPLLKPMVLSIQAVNLSAGSSGDQSQSLTKLYCRILNEYKYLRDIGKSIEETSSGLYVAFIDITILNKTDYLNTVDANLNQLVTAQSSESANIAALVQEAKSKGKDITDMNTVMKYFSDSIQYYKAAVIALNNYNTDKLDTDVTSYQILDKNAYDTAWKGIDMATNGYNTYYNLTQAN